MYIFFCHVIAARKNTDFLSKILILGYENTEKLKYNLAAVPEALLMTCTVSVSTFTEFYQIN